MKKILLITIGLSISLLADFSRDDNSEIVTDNETGLQWQDNESINETWEKAISYCEALTLGSYDDWRLPNINELGSIVDDTKYNPSLSPVFQSFSLYSYWSSTANANYTSVPWYIRFDNGTQKYDSRDTNRYIRCVRAGE